MNNWSLHIVIILSNFYSSDNIPQGEPNYLQSSGQLQIFSPTPQVLLPHFVHIPPLGPPPEVIQLEGEESDVGKECDIGDKPSPVWEANLF